ncbi:MAG: hypothetical protein IK009_06055, partial [Bacteroidales bacterium]|nr:hypothetical protein [Bacteroidales bacterium]
MNTIAAIAKGRYLRMYFHIGRLADETDLQYTKKGRRISSSAFYNEGRQSLRESRTESNSKKEVFQPHLPVRLPC